MRSIFTFCMIFMYLAAAKTQTNPLAVHSLKKSVLTMGTFNYGDCGPITDTTRDIPDVKDLEEVMDNIGAYELGTSFVYEYECKKYIITCEHVLYKTDSIVGYDSSYNSYQLKLVGTDMFYDIAVLEFVSVSDEADFEGISFDTSKAENNKVWGIGYWKWNGEPSIEHGNIVHCTEQADSPFPEMGYIKSDVQTAGGFSGGPLINAEGKVVGINTYLNRKSMTSYALKAEVLKNLVHHIIENDGSLQRIYVGLRFSQDATCGKVKVDDIIPDSPAAEHSQQLKNQYIKSINNLLVCDIYDVLTKLENMKAGNRLFIGLENGQSVSFFANQLNKENLQNIAVHAVQKHYKRTNRKKRKRTKVKIDKGEIVVIHDEGKDIIKTAGIKKDRIYCIDGPEQLGILIRLFGLHGHIELGKDDEHTFIHHVKFSNEYDKRVLYY